MPRILAARTSFGAPLGLLALLAVVSCSSPSTRRAPSTAPGTQTPRGRVRPGIEVLLEKRLDLVRSKRIGIVTNQTGADSRLRGTAELLAAVPGVRIAALFGPEHGLRGEAQAGARVPSGWDRTLGVPVFSLYGQTEKPTPEMLRDPHGAAKSLGAAVPEDRSAGDEGPIEVLVFDIQDVGTRAYTYISTLARCLEACAEEGIECVVLDRPNPIGGATLEGPVLDYPELSSPVGIYPIPARHGMTIGELALLFNDRFLPKRARLAVVPMEGWNRELWFEETGLPWVLPSPNMPSPETALVYPGQVLLEGTNISEGRGTTKPFELFGAPWIDARALAEALNALGLPGVAFREAWFVPTFSKYRGELCGGAQIHVLDRRAYRDFETTLHAIRALQGLYPERLEFRAATFDKLAGTRRVREALERGEPVEAIVAGFRGELEAFARLRAQYLLY